jgi:hypothetical protein
MIDLSRDVHLYMVIFDEAGDNLHERVGLTPDFYRAHGTGTMDASLI